MLNFKILLMALFSLANTLMSSFLIKYTEDSSLAVLHVMKTWK